MARSVSVKIPTSVVIEMVESKLAEMVKAEKDYPNLLATYNKDIRAYGKSLIELLSKNANKVVDYSTFDFNSDQITLTSDYRTNASVLVGKGLLAKLGDKPEKPEEVGNWHSKQKKEQLEKTLKLLKLTEQESVNASTYNSVLDLL
jgi:uncharacterized protein (DUF2344 family)